MSLDLKLFGNLLAWTLFFATTVYGHVGYKIAANQGLSLIRILLSGWGLTAGAAWVASGVLWVVILSENRLIAANSISTLRYILIALAAAIWLKETISLTEWCGIGLISLGILLISRSG